MLTVPGLFQDGGCPETARMVLTIPAHPEDGAILGGGTVPHGPEDGPRPEDGRHPQDGGWSHAILRTDAGPMLSPGWSKEPQDAPTLHQAWAFPRMAKRSYVTCGGKQVTNAAALAAFLLASAH